MFNGNNVCLRLLKEDETEYILKYYNDYEFRLNMLDVIPFSKYEEQSFIKTSWDLKNQGKAYIYGIEEIKTKTLIGSGGLANVNWINKSSTLGIGIWRKDMQGKGYGIESMNLLLNFAFNDIGLHTVYLEVYEFNQRAFELYKKIGFKEVGRKRDSVFRKGKYYNTIQMDILDIEFNNINKD